MTLRITAGALWASLLISCPGTIPGFVTEERCADAIEKAYTGQMTPAEAKRYMREPDSPSFPWEQILVVGGALLGVPAAGTAGAAYVRHRRKLTREAEHADDTA